MTSIKHAFSYYGSKAANVSKYPPPREDTIVEGFAGSAAYAQQYWEKRVILLDLDQYVFETWSYLISASKIDILGLPDISPGQDARDFDIPLGAQYLIGYWINQGSAMPKRKLSKRGAARGWWNRDKAGIADVVEHFNHWQVIRASFHQAPDIRATWFVDPPYQYGGEYYRESDVDYSHLANWCRARRGQVIVCENSKANWMDFEPLFENQGTRHKTTEVIKHWRSDSTQFELLL